MNVFRSFISAVVLLLFPGLAPGLAQIRVSATGGASLASIDFHEPGDPSAEYDSSTGVSLGVAAGLPVCEGTGGRSGKGADGGRV